LLAFHLPLHRSTDVPVTAPARRGVASALPGRIRLRDPALRRRAASGRLAAALRALRSVQQVDATLAAGSLLVHYDATACDRGELEAQVAQLIGAAMPVAATPAATAPSSPQRPSACSRPSRRRCCTTAAPSRSC